MSYIVAEYECPDHGRFDALVERDANGDAPGFFECQDPVDDGDADCGIMSPWVISGPFGKVKVASITQGKVSKAEVPTWTDTEALGDGMPLREWKKKRSKVWREYRYQQNKKDDRKGTA